MSELFEQAIERVRALPQRTQDDVARLLLRLAGDEGPVYPLTPEEDADLAMADEEIALGKLASDEQMRTLRAKLGL
ncbi:hypothetical protein ASF53_18320 [Methylobacterium sp. Leaf123]|uniref:hypothetical protein n=1 Tax=Methylobacterium sp. Leaf123 TaxID=1736264 RepID=UPI0006FECBAC|nr:hypothetical protein [Methylobacterium sp. Leaf123]KQQ30730.1 hypothetical protein ASF53_18320 [Methylobacterium sp. Leaf123]